MTSYLLVYAAIGVVAFIGLTWRFFSLDERVRYKAHWFVIAFATVVWPITLVIAAEAVVAYWIERAQQRRRGC